MYCLVLQVSVELRQLILELYERHLSGDGRSVSYKQLGRDPLFKKYVDATVELQRVSGTGRSQRGIRGDPERNQRGPEAHWTVLEGN